MSYKFDHKQVEKKWRKRWIKSKCYQPDFNEASKGKSNKGQTSKEGRTSTDKPFYNLMMFPYPSAEGLHVGNMYAFTGADVYGRFMRMQGYDVFEPIGLDGFGIHSENYAIKVGKHPKEQAKISQERFYDQLSRIGNGFAWDYRLETYDEEFYKWTQWLFVKMFEHGLAYRKKARVNWCPSCKTVLADEQVEGGVCERCKNETTFKDLEQWFFKITEYAEELLADIERLDWPEKIKIAQRNWIGKSEGLKEKWEVKDSKVVLESFTTWPHTTWGATFIVLAPEHPVVRELVKGTEIEEEVLDYCKGLIEERTRDRLSVEKEKKGMFLQKYAINPLTGWEMPVWVANFALMDVGTGVVKGCPAHDERDFEFARKYKLPIRKVIDYDKETHSVVMKKSVDDKFLGEVKKRGWYSMDYEDWGFGVVVPEGRGDEYVKLVQKHLQDGPWYVHTDGEVRKVIYKDKVFGIDDKAAKEYGKSLQIPDKEMNWDELEAYAFCYADDGVMVNAGDLTGMPSEEAKEKIMRTAVEKGYGERMTDYHLRDWLISRQRYWGPPIPMLYCRRCAEAGKSWFTESKEDRALGNIKSEASNSKQSLSTNDQNSKGLEFRNSDLELSASMAGWYPVPESELPVLLPDLEDWKPKGDGSGPLGNAPKEWLEAKCPKCGGRAVRETDVSDTFLDSSWYYLGYPNLKSEEWKKSGEDLRDGVPWHEELTRKWLPVDKYIGGAEHAVLHLLYSRFVWKFLLDKGYLKVSGSDRAGGREPFPSLFGHGLIIKDGAKMSKSRGNVVNPDEYVKKYGADALRMYLMFLGPYDQGGDFRDTGMAGMRRFVDRIWDVFDRGLGKETSAEMKSKLHETIEKVGKDMKRFKYNTAISAIMELINAWRSGGEMSIEDARLVLKMLAPIMPYMSEELWERLGGKDFKAKNSKKGEWVKDNSVHYQLFPEFDKKYIKLKQVVLVLQVNGKLRLTLRLDSEVYKEMSKDEVIEKVKKDEKMKKWLPSASSVQGVSKSVRKVIYVPASEGRQGLVNFVVA